ncbi:hypothetical protein BEL04_09475 [Mucilaginibacter sp. PPCGB 2223]|uniref:hypothetical protein n=1 Tax=Mucilaginibacter sp. PPCGB 2223 TaxID=1886027 RepID=UPI000826F776|nr:hypothetical protein [Mucilaginibacter sp. PPCGB 2223]OCX54460.1 hypothetical protein BEL04_09475 [Mucilaginibacter sp. PPCGB 2223]
MENAKDHEFEEELSSQAKSPESAIILEALTLLREVKRYRGFFYKQKVASLEAKARKLNIG